MKDATAMRLTMSAPGSMTRALTLARPFTSLPEVREPSCVRLFRTPLHSCRAAEAMGRADDARPGEDGEVGKT